MSYKYYEFKYLIPAKSLDYTLKILNTMLLKDPYPENWVSSIYFDSYDLKSYKECLDGSANKRKFRIREYEGVDKRSLQVKEKNLSAVHKYKAKLNDYQGYQWPLLREFDADDPQQKKICTLASEYGMLKPVLKTRYYRHRFRFNDARVTLDKNIQIYRYEEIRIAKNSCNWIPFAVLEVKSQDPNPTLPFLRLINTSLTSFSKYGLGMGLLEGQQDLLNKYL